MKKFKQLEKELNENYKKSVKEAKKQETATIKLYLSDDDDFLSPFSMTDEPVINEDVAAFIENQAQNISPKQDLILTISGDCIDERKKRVYPAAIKKYFTEKYYFNKNELKRDRVISRLLALIGLVIIGVSIYLQYRGRFPVWTEAIDIMAWVFFWEAVDIGAFGIKAIKFRNKKYLALIDMKIVFDK